MASGVTITGLQEAKARLAGFSDRRLHAAAATALTRTALDVRDAIKAEMARTFDRPTPFTLASVFVKPATAAQPVAEVGIKDKALRTLTAEVRGGVRPLKKFEAALARVGALPSGHYVVPGAGAQLDIHGGIPRRTISQILVALGARPAPKPRGTTRTTRRRAAATYFVAKPGEGLDPGVWRHDPGARRPVPVLLFVRGPMYRTRLPFEAVAKRIAEAKLAAHFGRSFSESAARLAARG